jgi:ATP-dependent Clp protease protease subunit
MPRSLFVLATLGLACAHTPPASAVEVELSDRQITLTGAISESNITKAVTQLLQLDGQSHEPVWLMIDSPGGAVDAGLVLIDVMKTVKSPVYTVVVSKAYSMGAIIAVFGAKRFIFPHATMMFHEASYGAIGEDPSIRSRIDFSTKYLDRLHVEIAGAIGMPVDDYRKRIRDAWWVTADEAVKAKMVGAVITKMSYREIADEEIEIKRTRTFKSRTTTRAPETAPLDSN